MIYDTYTTATDEPGLTLETLLKAYAEIEATLPRLLYRCSDYMPLLTNEGEPMVMKISPSKMDAGLIGRTWELVGLEDYLLLHPDNLPQLRQACAGKFRLEPVGYRRKR